MHSSSAFRPSLHAVLLCLGLLIILSICALLYLPTLGNWGAGDDLFHLLHALHNEPTNMAFFRPLERFIIVSNVTLLGTNDLRFALGVNLCGLALSCCLAFLLMRRIFPKQPAAALFAAALVGFSPYATTASVQIDTLSQQYASVFGLLFFYVSLTVRHRAWLWLALPLICFLGMVSKESTLGVLAAVPLATYLVGPKTPAARAQFTKSMLLFAVVFGLYLALRHGLGYSFQGSGKEGYVFQFGAPLLLKRLSFYYGGLALFAGNTLDFFPWLHPARAAVSIIFSLTCYGLAAWGFYASGRHYPQAAALLLLAGSSAFPVAISSTPSELYVYSALPFTSMLLAGGLSLAAGYLPLAKRTSRILLGTLSCLLLAWLLFGSAQKIRAYTQVATRSRAFYRVFVAEVAQQTKHPTKVCWHRSPDSASQRDYSVYIRSDDALAERTATFVNLLEAARYPVQLHTCDLNATLKNGALTFSSPSSPQKH